MLVAGSDRTINPDLERWYATRANSHKVEVSAASHAVYASRPKEVAALIEELHRTLARRGYEKGFVNGHGKLECDRGQCRRTFSTASTCPSG